MKRIILALLMCMFAIGIVACGKENLAGKYTGELIYDEGTQRESREEVEVELTEDGMWINPDEGFARKWSVSDGKFIMNIVYYDKVFDYTFDGEVLTLKCEAGEYSSSETYVLEKK